MECWISPFKKGNLGQKSFSDNVEWSCKTIISAEIKINVKQEIKELVAASYNWLLNFSKLEIQCKTGLYF